MFLSSTAHSFKPRDRTPSSPALFDGIGWRSSSPLLLSLIIALFMSMLLGSAPTFALNDCERIRSGDYKIRAISKQGDVVRILTSAGFAYEIEHGLKLMHSPATHFRITLPYEATKQVPPFPDATFNDSPPYYFMVARGQDTLIGYCKAFPTKGSNITIDGFTSWNNGTFEQYATDNEWKFKGEYSSPAFITDSTVDNRAYIITPPINYIPYQELFFNKYYQISSIITVSTFVNISHLTKNQQTAFKDTPNTGPLSGVIFNWKPSGGGVNGQPIFYPHEYAMLIYADGYVLFFMRNTSNDEIVHWDRTHNITIKEIIECKPDGPKLDGSDGGEEPRDDFMDLLTKAAICAAIFVPAGIVLVLILSYRSSSKRKTIKAAFKKTSAEQGFKKVSSKDGNMKQVASSKKSTPSKSATPATTEASKIKSVKAHASSNKSTKNTPTKDASSSVSPAGSTSGGKSAVTPTGTTAQISANSTSRKTSSAAATGPNVDNSKASIKK